MNYEPLKMQPCYKQYLWGGSRLKQQYGKADAPAVTAESWELASHPDGSSLVAQGPYAGRDIAWLGRQNHDAFWGTDCTGEAFPLLVKLIDAGKALSVQVHPSDATADPNAGEQGKTELWYIVDADPQASLYFGFSREVDKEELLRRARDGSICAVLNRVPVAPGDVFFIRPGTIHAIGAGILVAEIQQNSNTTFRVYDYQRRSADGSQRPLHLQRAAQVMDYHPVVPEECRPNAGIYTHGFTMAEVCTCPYFQVYRAEVSGALALRCAGDSFRHLLCVGGDGAICVGEKTYPFHKGESYFLPAALGEYRILAVGAFCRVLLTWSRKEPEP